MKVSPNPHSSIKKNVLSKKIVLLLFATGLCQADPVQDLLEKARTCNASNKKQEAIALYEQATLLEPTNLQAQLELGNLFFAQEKFPEAIARYQTILTYNPQCTSVIFNMAFAHSRLGQYHTAIPLYEKVLTQEPTHPYAQRPLGSAYLATGNFYKGWRYFEDRWTKPREDIRICKNYIKEHANLTGKSFLLTQEWGHGDAFFAIRYAQMLNQRGAFVIAQVKKELIPMFALCPYVDQVISTNQSVPAHDFTTAMLSLPWTFDTTDETKIPAEPYLYASHNLIKTWHEKLHREKVHADKNLKVGLCWRGSAGGSPTYLPRHVPTDLIIQLASLDGITFYSIQKGDLTQSDLDLLHTSKIIDLGSDPDFDATNGSFMDTAAVIRNLDLVITIDTSVAHLAGGLGHTPVWLLLAHAAAWYWMLDRSDSPWYPTMRIFRQPAPNDWQSVIDTVRTELNKLIKIKNDTH